MGVVPLLQNIKSITSKEPMWTFYVNDVTQNNNYMQLLEPICGLLPLLLDLRLISTERFVKSSVVHDFWSNSSLPLALHYQNMTG